MFSCELCNQPFTSKRSLDYHIEHKSCKNVDKIKCEYCDKMYTTKQSRDRHIRTSCKVNLENNKECNESIDNRQKILETLVFTMRSEIDELKKENNDLKKLVSSKSTNMINNTNNGIIANNINNYVLVGYGQTDLSKVDRDDLLKGIRTGFNSTLNLIDTVHFNPKYPEFHNVYISSMKNKYAMMYDGNNWQLMMKDDLIDKLYDDKRNYIEENLDEFLDSLSKSQIKALHRWLDVDDDYHYVKKIKNDIKLLLYNKRNQVICPNVSSRIEIDYKTNDFDDDDDYTFKMKNIKPSVYLNNTKLIWMQKPAGRPGTKRKVFPNRVKTS